MHTNPLGVFLAPSLNLILSSENISKCMICADLLNILVGHCQLRFLCIFEHPNKQHKGDKSHSVDQTVEESDVSDTDEEESDLVIQNLEECDLSDEEESDTPNLYVDECEYDTGSSEAESSDSNSSQSDDEPEPGEGYHHVNQHFQTRTGRVIKAARKFGYDN